MKPHEQFDKHGDTDEDVVMSHGISYYWTKRQTIWSVVIITGATAIGAFFVLQAYGLV